MSANPTCEQCGEPLAEAEGGFCPACILRQGIISATRPLGEEVGPTGPPPVFGSYELLGEIGRGGMGVVYKARQRSLKRTVAIKLLVAGAYSSESLLRRFQIEAESAAGLQHPGIVAIHEFGEYDNQPFYAMEYVEGRNLSEVTGGRPLAPRRAATYLRAIGEAVQYAHSRGILHRDLKPSNVLIDLDDRPRITDFGLAKQLHGHTDFTIAGQMLGSPNYAPPEQASGRDVGVTSDVYTLGGLLYNLLTGRPPFMASTVQETLRLVYETDPISPRSLNPDVPPDLDTICLKCLEKDPERRYPSAQILVDELGRFLRGEAISARKASSAELGLRWCRRHPAIASLAATVVAALVTTSAIFYNAARRVERARSLEHAAQLRADDELYAANMQVVAGAFMNAGGFDPQNTKTLLDETRPKAGARDLRGFEWRHFWYRTRSHAVVSLRGHVQVVDAVLYSPGGGRIATHSIDGNLRLWDAASHQQVRSLDGVAEVGGFTADDTGLIFRHAGGSLWRLDIAGGGISPAGWASGRLLGLLPGGQAVADFGPDNLPRLRRIDGSSDQDGAAEIPPDICSALSADGRRAAVAGRLYHGIIVTELADHRTLATLADPRPLTAVALSPDGRRLISAGFDGVLKIWDVDRGDLLQTLKAFLDPIWGMAFSADGTGFAAGGNNRSVKVWDTATWQETNSLDGHASTVRCVAFSPDGRDLVSSSEDETAMLWSVHSHQLQTEMPQLLRGPRWIDRTAGIAFSPDSRMFAGTAADGTIKVWRTDTIDCLATFPSEARTVAFSPDGKSVLGEGFDGIVQRWMLDGSGEQSRVQPKARFANWQVDPLTPGERVALVADQRETRAACGLCAIPSARDGMFGGAMQSAPTIAMSADGRIMYVGLPQGRVEVWDVATRRQQFAFAAHKLGVSALAVSPDGRYLATGSLDNSTVLWEAATGRELATFHAHNRPVWALAFSPDGQTLAAGSCDKQIVLCSVPLRRHVASLALYTGAPRDFEQEVRLLRFSPDGNILAAGLGDGTLRFFRAAAFAETDAAPAEPKLSSL